MYRYRVNPARVIFGLAVSTWRTTGLIRRGWPRFDFDPEFPVDLGRGVYIVPLPGYLKDAYVTNVLKWEHVEALANYPQYALSIEYEATALGEPDPAWRGSGKLSRQEVAREALIYANLATWLARPTGLGFAWLVHADMERAQWVVRQVSPGNPLHPHSGDIGARLSRDDVATARALHDRIFEMQSSGSVWIAVRSLWGALTNRRAEDRYVLLWISLEALFGPTDGREITYRLSQRLAFFLAPDRSDAAALFQQAKRAYATRSKLVHGARPKMVDHDWLDLMHRTEDWVRSALVGILQKPEYLKIFTTKEREPFLDSLPFS